MANKSDHKPGFKKKMQGDAASLRRFFKNHMSTTTLPGKAPNIESPILKGQQAPAIKPEMPKPTDPQNPVQAKNQSWGKGTSPVNPHIELKASKKTEGK